MSQQAGGCLCSRIRYAVTVDPPPRVAICHCKFCQRATGAPYFVEAIFEKPQFSVTSGSPKVYTLISEGSGKAININFCDNCGTKLFLSTERNPAVIGVYGGTFDDPNWFDRSPQRSKVIFTNYAQKGSLIPAGYKTYPEHPRTRDGTPTEPIIFEEHIIVGGNK